MWSGWVIALLFCWRGFCPVLFVMKTNTNNPKLKFRSTPFSFDAPQGGTSCPTNSYRPTSRQRNSNLRHQRSNLGERGQGLVEYLILVALISVATIAVVRVVGQALNSKLASVAYALQGQRKKPAVDSIPEAHLKKRDLSDFMNGVGRSGGAGGGSGDNAGSGASDRGGSADRSGSEFDF